MITAATYNSLTLGESAEGGGRGYEPLPADGGCFSRRAASISAFVSAIGEVEEASLTTPLKSPSSRRDDTNTRACQASEVSREPCRHIFGELDGHSFLSTCPLIVEAKECLLPPRGGVCKHLRAKDSNLSQDESELTLVTSCNKDTNLDAT